VSFGCDSLLAIEFLEIGEQQFDTRFGDAVPERLPLTPEVDETLVPHFREMLRER
jgi:hypothetical protein